VSGGGRGPGDTIGIVGGVIGLTPLYFTIENIVRADPIMARIATGIILTSVDFIRESIV
jgi:hypothetical protein